VRPTLALGEWRIATDLIATRAIAGIVPPPVCGRACFWCRNWAVAYVEALPEFLLNQLGRIGIDPTKPTDLYAYDNPDPDSGLIPHRATFHAVGKILSGPSLWIELTKLGTHRNYVRPEGAPETVGLSIGLASQLPDRWSWSGDTKGPLLEVDFRLLVPWLLAESVPQP
jgi:hypothetical protein